MSYFFIKVLKALTEKKKCQEKRDIRIWNTYYITISAKNKQDKCITNKLCGRQVKIQNIINIYALHIYIYIYTCICYVTFSVHRFSGQFLSIAVSACILPRSPRNSVCGATSRCIIRFCSQHSSTQLRPTTPTCGTTDLSTLVRSITLFVYVFITCIPMGSCNFSFRYT